MLDLIGGGGVMFDLIGGGWFHVESNWWNSCVMLDLISER